MTATLCEWCGAPLPRFGDDDDPTICAGRYACSRRKAMEEGQEDRDAEIATLKAEVARLTKERDAGEMRIATLLAVRDPQPAIATLAANLDRIAKERDNLSLTLRGTLARADGMEADLARHQRALAAGPARLREMAADYDRMGLSALQVAYQRSPAAVIRSADLINAALHVEAAQRRAMEEDKP